MSSKELFAEIAEHEAKVATLKAQRPPLGDLPRIAEARYRANNCTDRFGPNTEHFVLNRPWYQCKVRKVTDEGVEWEVWYPRSEPDYEGEYFTTWAELDAGMEGAQAFFDEKSALIKLTRENDAQARDGARRELYEAMKAEFEPENA